MESIEKEYERLRKKSNLSKTITDVDKCIQLLQNARAAIANGTSFSASPTQLLLTTPPPPPPPDPSSAATNLTKLQQTLPAALDKINDTQTEIYRGLNRYGRSLDKVCPLSPSHTPPPTPH